MPSAPRVSVPLLAPLIPDGVEAGTIFLVEFDPESQWVAVAATITAGYLRAGGRVAYVAQLRSPETLKKNLFALGVDVPTVISEGRFSVDDFYSAALTGGRLDGGPSVIERIEGGHRARSLKVADLSVEWLKDLKQDAESVFFETWPWEWKNFLCIRSLKGQPHDARWHEIQIKRNGEAVLGS